VRARACHKKSNAFFFEKQVTAQVGAKNWLWCKRRGLSVSQASAVVRTRSTGKLQSVEGLFSGRHFDREVIILCVRWYLRFKLSFGDLVEMMAERGLSLAHMTIMRCVLHYAAEG
jgi:hypothetical protein